MSKNYKCVSHAEAVRNSALHNRHVAKLLQEPYGMDAVEQDVENGLVVRRSVVRDYSPVENFRGYNATDFALENIIAAGAMDMLRDSRLSYASTSEVSDGLEPSIDNLMGAVDAAAENNVSNTND